uniref:Small ribosomal subunit protein uS10c n=2 Tax=Scytosiphon TaxID=27966 RepID=A0A7T8G546_SCYLO|nr:30S ribosomal protein S10 [Scytosiphon promiscuus]YP_010147399.1 30S ribosomal protein S10 [Scytosiphon lomentaria]QDM58299.1 30S ribosomal protein S10 [Scytosiphon promiscuus]QDM58442.1 30S ribosomal protein S10 [Scytosiphon promiscuus]QQP22190.1 30S ribosomal protein S10 [Scytosiphon lomentaria]QTW91529.1 ribosomal protein S10 [Scytosiphon lomentaria]WAM64537.1 30S ribosomal protein S10 [Scytosiphon lomentaria]
MSNEKIRITLQSFNHLVLNECCKKISDVLTNDNSVLKVAGPISFPTKKRSYCVLRSPHVNKDSREQFEIRRYKKIIDIESNSKEIVNILLSLDLSPGVSTELYNYK